MYKYKNLTIYKILPEESKFIGMNILFRTEPDFKFSVLPVSKLLTIECQPVVEVPKYKFGIAAIEFLEAIGYVRGKHNGKVKYYLKSHSEEKMIKSARDILNKDKTPTLCYLLETEIV